MQIRQTLVRFLLAAVGMPVDDIVSSYGFSDCAPTSAFGHVAGALEEALEKAGEFARVSKPGGGFVLVAEGYGG